MFCPKCHTHIIDDSTKFCSRCGESLEKKKRRSTFSTGSSFSSISSGSTFKYMSKYGKKDALSKFDHENIGNEKTLEKILNEDPEGCNINQPANANNHNDQFNYSLKYSGVTKKRQSHDEQFNYSKNYSGVTKKGKTHEEQYNYSQRYSNVQPATQQRTYATQQQVPNDDTYRLAFIGQNKESIIRSSFSVPALLFGPLYLVYRKMIGIGLLIEFIILIIQASFGSDTASAIQVFIHVILAFKFRTMYLNFVNKKVKEIKDRSQNKTSTEIAYECSVKGKTLNLKQTIKYIIIFYILSLFATAYYEVDQKSIDDTYNNTSTPTYNTNMEESKYIIGSYEFESSYDEYIREITSNENTIHLEYTQSDNQKCNIIVDRIYSRETAYSYLNNQKNDFPSYTASDMGLMNIGNNNWVYLKLNPVTSQKHSIIYAMKDDKNEEIYMFNTNSYNLNECTSVAQEMMRNFKKNY